ncbi:imidazole glycerol phosphate synthase subunit HisF [Neolewinella xylanilytica]|uniref:imidazole glycerol phosphate synthase subunit HisF n=1 Tax=Neolewinella xylanilytica TaxID=1514080 RepID=UPI000CEAAE29|nr:imidazole glycerol phosphate synthase subunit HisF [Neolewinella xylanilytica]
MLAKRIIPCLDIKDGRTVKGVNFVNLRDAGDPVELGAKYSLAGADELVFLDITATHERRKTLADLARDIARHLNIPFTIGGGIRELKDVDVLLDAGADKVSINSAAVRRPQLIDELAYAFGKQFVVVAVDARFIGSADDPGKPGEWYVHLNGGRIKTEHKLFDWVTEAQERGAGEILFTSMDHDGTKAGFANEALAEMSDRLSIPIIASGGAGNKEHFAEVFTTGKADAGLAASIFHFGEVEIADLKAYLAGEGVAVRPVG